MFHLVGEERINAEREDVGAIDQKNRPWAQARTPAGVSSTADWQVAVAILDVSGDRAPEDVIGGDDRRTA